MKRSYYSSTISHFLKDSDQHIIGELVLNHEFAVDEPQKYAWMSQIEILKSTLKVYPDSFISFEYAIPRMGKRVDVVFLHKGIIFLLEFKNGENTFHQSAINQVLDYSLDLKNFQEQSHNRDIVPIVVATEASTLTYDIIKYPDSVYYPALCNKHNISTTIDLITTSNNHREYIDPEIWINSIYKPTPTIIEAAQALYKGHSVKEISRSDSGAQNLDKTSNEISNIIEYSKETNRKSICFITGVPGAGKTLAGLNIANERHNIDKGEHAVFLSGNGPLVEVLQEALARNEFNEKKKTTTNFTKGQALTKTKAFIQNIHHFRDDALHSEKAPIEKVAVFDEAQRAWTLEQTKSFMLRKKGIADFNMSEPNFLISVFDRHDGWAVIVCLIGGGQEINTGEAGLPEWFSAIQQNYKHWDVYISKRITDNEFTNGINFFHQLIPINYH